MNKNECQCGRYRSEHGDGKLCLERERDNAIVRLAKAERTIKLLEHDAGRVWKEFGIEGEETAYEVASRLNRAASELRERFTKSETRGRTGSVLQDWVMTLGLRKQGTLLSGIRGCDTVPKHHPTKLLIRGLRADVLNSFCGDPKKAKTYIRPLSHEEMVDLLPQVLDSQDELPAHYISHLIHAIEVLAFCHPDPIRRSIWNIYYLRFCKRWHMHPETPEDMDRRLEAPEEAFAVQEDEI